VWFLMPDPQPKRVRVAEQLTSPRRVTPRLDEEALRDRLRAIRDDTAQHLDDLLGQLTSTLREQYSITPLEATTAQEAADEIARLAGPSRRVLVNRSVTVAELLPYLEAHGLEVVETYDGQFTHPEQGVDRYWQLQLPSAEAAWEAFRPQTIKLPPPQSGDPSAKLRTSLGVLGVNVIAADDGTVFFVQHFFNISEILEQASQVVLVVGVERVVRDRDAAAFVARAQARYGVLSVALGVPRRGGHSKGELPAGRGLIPSLPARDVQHAPMHVILLDNGRRAWLSDPRYRDLFLCIGCRSCLLECPTPPFIPPNGGERGGGAGGGLDAARLSDGFPAG
jgi:L-lactate utilization protein LutB